MIASIQGRSNLKYRTMYSSRSAFVCPLHLNAAYSSFPPIIHSIPENSFLLILVPLHLLQIIFLWDCSTFCGLSSSRWSATFAYLLRGLFSLSLAIFVFLIVLDWYRFLFLFLALSFFLLVFGLFFSGRGRFALLGGWWGWSN